MEISIKTNTNKIDNELIENDVLLDRELTNEEKIAIRYQIINNKETTVHWKQLATNCWSFQISPEAVLIPEGCILEHNVKLVGESKIKPKTVRPIIFDKQFVIQKLIKDVVKPLDGLDFEEMIQVLEEAFNAYQDGYEMNGEVRVKQLRSQGLDVTPIRE